MTKHSEEYFTPALPLMEEIKVEGEDRTVLMTASGLLVFAPGQFPEPLELTQVPYKISYCVSMTPSKFRTVKAHGMQALELTRKPKKDGT